MTAQQEIYKCSICGNIVEVLHSGVGALVCCGKNMGLLAGNSTDAAQEKHVPVLDICDDNITVSVGSVAHPMQDEHFIEWIEIIADDVSHRAFLKPGAAPKACFSITASKVTARAYCNLHGLWQATS
ncbi:MAG: desulfoferrodoxin [Thermodesulfobacteriota bacterium]|nr:desulfoferrodoxin [Thermodesulfobacteriota bacterium]